MGKDKRLLFFLFLISLNDNWWSFLMHVNETGFLKKIIEATIKMYYGICKINARYLVH